MELIVRSFATSGQFYQIMKRPKAMHCGLSFMRLVTSSSPSSGMIGAAFSTTESRFTLIIILNISKYFVGLTVETVTRSRKVVSIREHLVMGRQA